MTEEIRKAFVAWRKLKPGALVEPSNHFIAGFEAGRAHDTLENEKLRQQVVAQQMRINFLTLAVEAAEEQTDDEALRYGFKYALSIKDDLSALAAHDAELLAAKDAEFAMLRELLERSLTDVKSKLKEFHDNMIGNTAIRESWKYQGDLVDEIEQALSSTTDTWLNEHDAKVLEEAIEAIKINLIGEGDKPTDRLIGYDYCIELLTLIAARKRKGD